MLSFMRRNQRLFFVIVTAVIIVSFSFFGTYQSFLQGGQRGEAAFTAINGKKISQRELSQMALFLSTEADTPGGNPLNDGVVSRHLFESGLALLLAGRFQEPIEGELLNKATVESRFFPYRHPYAPMLGAEWIWSSFAPDIKEGLEALKANLPFEERFAKKIALYLAERDFPQSSLKQMIRFQEGQAQGLPSDGDLAARDLSLYGYHTLQDWFGPTFMNLTAEVITQGSIIAEERGYTVSKREAFADLIHNAEVAASRYPTLYAGSSKGTLEGILRRMGMTPNEATALWQRVLLFRRLLEDSGSSPLLDTLPFERFAEYAGARRQIAHYALPGHPTLKNSEELLAFESYLDAVYQRSPENLADLPSEVRPLQEVKRRAPELVYREYPLEIKEVNREMLGMEIPIREIWNWQLQDAGWETLESRIPALERQKGEKFSRLKTLDSQSRQKADEIARKAILKAHPERVLTALEAEEAREQHVKLPFSGPSPLKGVDPKQLMDKLQGAEGPILLTGDEFTFEITLLGPPSEERVFLYNEAKQVGALRALADRRVEEAYQARRERGKPLSQVREELVTSLTAATTRQLLAQLPEAEGAGADYAAKNRFVPYLSRIRDERQEEVLFFEEGTRVWKGDPLATQWEVERQLTHLTRGQTLQNRDFEELTRGTTSEVYIDPTRGTTFYRIGEVEQGHLHNPLLYDSLQRALSHEAQGRLFAQLLDEIETRGGLELTGREG
ncbi:MAG: SurA N-terminal domain-containing protein [Parachlamydiales bacterium]